MNSLIKTVSVMVALSCSAAFADNTINGTLGTNTQTNNTYNNDSADTVVYGTQHTSTSTTSVNNSQVTPNGYVTSTPVTPGQNTCVYGHGESLSAAGIGISSGKVYVDEGCQKIRDEAHRLNQLRQNVTLMANIGLKDAAVSMMCQDYTMRQSLRLSLPEDVYNKLCKKFER